VDEFQKNRMDVGRIFVDESRRKPISGAIVKHSGMVHEMRVQEGMKCVTYRPSALSK